MDSLFYSCSSSAFGGWGRGGGAVTRESFPEVKAVTACAKKERVLCDGRASDRCHLSSSSLPRLCSSRLALESPPGSPQAKC